jgi:hypothetical protein
VKHDGLVEDALEGEREDEWVCHEYCKDGKNSEWVLKAEISACL